MISVLLVEDNKLALEYLEMLVDWETNGFKVVATALNGKDGFSKYLALKPQLIITDIQMPSISGVDMAKRIREIDSCVKIVFLTSYQEFSYARSALDLSVSEYILKHELNEQALLKKLLKVKIELDSLGLMSKLKFENDVLENMLEDQFTDIKTEYSVIAFQRDAPLDVLNRGSSTTSSFNVKLVKNVCYNLNENTLGVIQAENEMYLLFISPGVLSVNDFAYELKNALETSFASGFTVLIIDENVGLEECKRQLPVYRDMLSERFFSRRSMVLNAIFFEDKCRSGDYHIDERSILQLIERKDTDEILKQIEALFSSILKQKDYYGLLDVSRGLMSILLRFEQAENMLRNMRFKPFEESDKDKWLSARGLVEFFRDKFIDLIDILNADKSDKYSPHVKSAICFIVDGYKNVELSVESIAEGVGMNADWLGTIFKRDTGYSIREYLNIYRINKSMELIDGGCKVQEVFKEVGYMTYQYYGKVFRKITGLTPAAYRGRNDKTTF